MKIIFVNRFFYPDHSATSQLLGDLAFDFAARDKRVLVITSRQKIDDPAAALPASEIVERVMVRRVWTTRSGRGSLAGRALDYLSFYLTAGWMLFRSCEAGDVIVVKTDPPLLSVPCAWIAAFRRGQLINWLHDLFPEVAQRLGLRGLPAWPCAVLRTMRNASLHRARLNVVLGEQMAAVLKSEGVEAGKIRIIHNWCDGNTVRPVSSRNNALREEWGLGTRFVVMYSGNMGRAHEFETMVAAACILRSRRDVVFVFVGDGVRRQWIENEMARRGLRNMIFKPYQPRERLAQSLGAADVHLISLRPSLEGLVVPSKFYGIAAAGRPVIYIGSADGEIPRILADHRCGITVAEGDGERLAGEIMALADDSRDRAAKGEAARAVFEKAFDKPVALAAWREAAGL